MKKIVLIAVMTLSLASCEKFDIRHPFKREKKEIPCPIVARESIPVVVSKTFKDKYPNATSETWFNKDNTGFCASFLVNGNKMLVFFNNDGSFVNETVENNQQGEHHDNDENKGCSCELEAGE